MAAPTLLDYVESNFTDNTANETTSAALDWSASGDRIFILGMTEDNARTLATPVATGLTFSALTGTPTNTPERCKGYGWSATAAASGSQTVTVTNSGNFGRGIAAWAFSGVGTVPNPVVSTGAGITQSVTVAEDESSVIMIMGDWNATTDVTADITPAGGTIRELSRAANGSTTTAVLEWHNQAAGTRSYGLANWTGVGNVTRITQVVPGIASADPNEGTAALGLALEVAADGERDSAGTSAAGLALAVAATGDAPDVAPAEGTATLGLALAAAATGEAPAGGGPFTVFDDTTPAITDANDSDDLSLGTVVIVAEAGSVTHARWYFPDTPPSGPVTWRLSDLITHDLLGSHVFTDPVAGQWNEQELSSPVALDAGQAVVAWVGTPDRYVATTGFFTSAGTTNGPLTAPATGDDPEAIGNGRFNGDPTSYPASSSGGNCYFVDLVFESAAPVVGEGSADVGLALAAAAEGARGSASTAAVGLAVDVAATGEASGVGPSEGAADAALALAVVGTGARDSAGTTNVGITYVFAVTGNTPDAGTSEGTAVVGLGLAVAAAGARPSSGSAALGLGLALTATGSDGEPVIVPPERMVIEPAEVRVAVESAEPRLVTEPAESRFVVEV